MDSIRQEALVLAELGHEVTVFAVEDSDSDADRHQWEPLNVRLFKPLGPGRFSYGRGMARAVSESSIDVLSSHGLWRYTSVATTRWHRGAGRPYVVSPHGMLDRWAIGNSAMRKRLAAAFFERKHLREAVCIRALTTAEAEAVRSYGLTNPIAIIPNGVVLPQPQNGVPPPWQTVGGFSGAKVLLSLGRLHPKKNLIELLRAWADAERAAVPGFDAWRLVIAGWDEGGHAEQLTNVARELGLGDSVWFAGPLFGEPKDSAFRNARAFVIPSVSEGLPMVVLEAWSYGLPVLMTPQCNLPEGLAAGAATLIGTDAAGIAHGIAQLIEASSGQTEAMGARGRELAVERFDWSRIGADTQQLLKWLTGSANQPKFVIS